ncbi:MAG: hypothetical protein R2932_26950 [Caldilineaceae bacterium]
MPKAGQLHARRQGHRLLRNLAMAVRQGHKRLLGLRHRTRRGNTERAIAYPILTAIRIRLMSNCLRDDLWSLPHPCRAISHRRHHLIALRFKTILGAWQAIAPATRQGNGNFAQR